MTKRYHLPIRNVASADRRFSRTLYVTTSAGQTHSIKSYRFIIVRKEIMRASFVVYHLQNLFVIHVGIELRSLSRFEKFVIIFFCYLNVVYIIYTRLL